MKLKRILAWVIDWNLSGLPALTYALLFWTLLSDYKSNPILFALLVLFVLSFPVIFVCRDVIFKGRSPAKRIFGLCVIDNETNALPSNDKLIIRNLFFFIYPVEAIFLIATDKSIGDNISATTITYYDERRAYYERQRTDYSYRKPKTFCHSCGVEVSDTAIICEQCGAFLNGDIIKTPKGTIPKRSLATSIIFSIITLGIYYLYWFVCLTNEINRASGRNGDTSGMKALLFSIITLGIYELYWAYKLGEKSDIISRAPSRTYSTSGVLYLILTALGFGILVLPLAQYNLNTHT